MDWKWAVEDSSDDSTTSWNIQTNLMTINILCLRSEKGGDPISIIQNESARKKDPNVVNIVIELDRDARLKRHALELSIQKSKL